MDINFNPQVNTVARVATSQVKSGGAAASTDEVVLDESKQLEARFAEMPDTRSAMIERGKALVADPNYPPNETVQKIAHLLAINFQRIQ